MSDLAHQPASREHIGPRTYYTVFAILMGLLVLTVVVAELDIGRAAFAVAAAIACTKAVLIVLYFMHVRESIWLTWLVAASGFFWLAILLLFSFADYLTRGWLPYSGVG